MTIQEGNKLIAEFMGKEWHGEIGYVGDFYFKHGVKDKDDPISFMCEAQYHERWDWLMPVVEKICGLTIGDDVLYVKSAYPRTFGMKDEDGTSMVRLNGFTLHKSDKLIDATYSAVIEFINWYNTQKDN